MTGTVDPARVPTREEFQALVTIETAERLAGRAALAIGSGDTLRALAILEELVGRTTNRTCTAVKRQSISDEIARLAAQQVRGSLDAAERELREAALRREALIDTQEEARGVALAEAEAEHEAAIERSIAEHEADLASRDEWPGQFGL